MERNQTARIAYPDTWHQIVRDELDAMFAKARHDRLWFFHNSLGVGPMWFTPDELETAQRAGRFIWGTDNWRLRDPRECLAEEDRALAKATKDRDEVAARVNAFLLASPVSGKAI